MLEINWRQIILKPVADVCLMSRTRSLYFYVRSSTAFKIVLHPHKTLVSDQLLACGAGNLEPFRALNADYSLSTTLSLPSAQLCIRCYAHRAAGQNIFLTGAVGRLLHSRAPHASSSSTLWLREAATASATPKNLRGSHNLPQKRARKKPVAVAMGPEKRSVSEVMTAHAAEAAIR